MQLHKSKKFLIKCKILEKNSKSLDNGVYRRKDESG